jgi:hypothetical protein
VKLRDTIKPGTRIRVFSDHKFGRNALAMVTEPSQFALPDELTIEFDNEPDKRPGTRRFVQEGNFTVLSHKRLTISGEDVRVVSKAPDEVVVEVANFNRIDSEDFKPTPYVRVRAGDHTHTQLTYIDPTGTLKVGDRVIVPMGYQNRDTFGEVIALGRGRYPGQCKTVKAKLLVEELSA